MVFARRAAALCVGLSLAPVRAMRLPAQVKARAATSVVASALPRRALFAAGASLLAAAPLPALAEKKPASDGSWAKRFEAFEDSDFEGFSTSPSGLKYKVFEEGYGVKPVAGQKIKVSRPR